MIASRRWQDWATTILGVLLFISPFVFGATYDNGASWTAYIGGGIVFLIGLAMLVWPEFTIGEYGQVLAGVVLFLTPWVIGFTTITAMAWTAWILGILLVVFAGSVLFLGGGRVERVATS